MVRYNPFSEELYTDPFPMYRELRDESPVHYMEEFNCWFLSRFEDIWENIGDERLTAAQGVTSVELLLGRPQTTGSSLAALDEPHHLKLRTQLNPHFLRSATRRLEPITREFVRGFLDEAFERGEFDIVGDYAMKLSVRVACTILGIPLEDADFLANRVNRFFGRDEGVRGQTDGAVVAMQELQGYLMDWVARRRREPAREDDVLGKLLAFESDGLKFEDGDIASSLQLVVIGGTETLPKAVAAAVLRLFQQPDQRAELVRDPDLVPAAFWEAVRYDMPTSMLGRRVTREIEIGGKTLEPGQGLMFLWACANRDEREFDDADRFDIRRNAPRILSFGHATHRCMGANVAQMEGRVLLEELLMRAPDYEVLEDRAVSVRSEFFRGFVSLPIRVAN